MNYERLVLFPIYSWGGGEGFSREIRIIVETLKTKRKMISAK
jgi:hypothetical protein